VAALMPTGMTTTEGQHILNSALFEEIFTNDKRQLGDAIARAKMTLLANGDAYYEEVSRTFLLFGDPAMVLKVPVPRRVGGLTAAADAQYNAALSWQEAFDADGAAVAGYHVYRKTAADAGYSRITAQPVDGTDYTDADVNLGTRYYYVVRSVDADGLESVNSESVSVVVPVPTASLVGPGSGGGGGGVCFISASQEAYNQNIMNGLAFLGLVVLLWQLIMRIKARKAGSRKSYSHRGPNSAFDEVTEFELQISTGSHTQGDSGMGGSAGKKGDVTDLTEDPPVAA